MQEQDSTIAPQVEYRDTPGFPGYRVGNDGSVWSQHQQSRGGRIGGPWRKLTPKVARKGYLALGLTKDGKRVHCYVHRLVLEAFVGPCPDGMVCCHNNGIPNDNRVENLRWDTQVNNLKDRIAHGTENKGEQHGRAVLTGADVIEARSLYATGGWSYPKLGKKYGVTHATMRRAVVGIHWSHLA